MKKANKFRLIHYGGMVFEKEEKEAVRRVLKRNWWALDKEGRAFEKELAEYVGVKYAIFVNSGSSALLLIFQALNKFKSFFNNEIIVPATCFPTDISSILLAGFWPKIVDVNLEDFLISVDRIKENISPNTFGILAVHTAGNICNLKEIKQLCRSNGLYLIEDNCDGFGGKFDGEMAGSFGISATSFHAAHIISTGQGGAIFTNNWQLAETIKSMRDWGRMTDFDDNARGIHPLPEDYQQRYTYTDIGFNLNPIELQAAIGREQLKKIERFKKARQYNFQYLKKKLDKKRYYVVSQHPLADPGWFTVPILIQKGIARKEIFERLNRAKIEYRNILASNIALQPAYTQFASYRQFPNANAVANQGFWISCHPSLAQADLDYIIKVFNR